MGTAKAVVYAPINVTPHSPLTGCGWGEFGPPLMPEAWGIQTYPRSSAMREKETERGIGIKTETEERRMYKLVYTSLSIGTL